MIVKWSKIEILNSHSNGIRFDETIRFDKEVFKKHHHIRDLKDVNVRGSLRYDGVSDLVYCEMVVSGKMILPCAISQEDVEYPFTFDTEETFTFHKVEDDSDIHEAKGDVVELLPIIFSSIMMEIPLKVVKEGIQAYPKGDGWEVITEADYYSEKKKEIDPRLAKLKEFKIEEDS